MTVVAAAVVLRRFATIPSLQSPLAAVFVKDFPTTFFKHPYLPAKSTAAFTPIVFKELNALFFFGCADVLHKDLSSLPLRMELKTEAVKVLRVLTHWF